VVPWIYAALAGAGADAPAAFAERLEGMRQATREASKISPRFEGLSLFVDALSVGFEAASKREPGKAIQIPAPAQDDLLRRAEQLGRSSAGERYTQSGVLAVAALLAQQRDVHGLVELLPDALRLQDRLARAALRSWVAAARGRPEVAEKARAELTALMPEAARLGVDRAELVLLMAESDAALSGDARSSGVLGHSWAKASLRHCACARRSTRPDRWPVKPSTLKPSRCSKRQQRSRPPAVPAPRPTSPRWRAAI
jgi:hypothetical protein